MTVSTSPPSPTFHHEEIQELYRYGLRIDQEILRNILALPRETLLRDLENVLLDSQRRFEFFKKKTEENERGDEQELDFPLHALFLLTELKATEKLPLILDHLGRGTIFFISGTPATQPKHCGISFTTSAANSWTC